MIFSLDKFKNKFIKTTVAVVNTIVRKKGRICLTRNRHSLAIFSDTQRTNLSNILSIK